MKKFVILVIGNHSGHSNSVKDFLISNDFDVKTALNEKDAQEFMSENVIDLVLLETEKSVNEGISSCRTIKLKSEWSGIPVVFMINHNDLAIIEEIYESGGDDYVLKPLVWAELLMKVSSLLELKYSRQMAKNMNKLLEEKVAERTLELEDSLKKLGKANKELEILEIAKSEFLDLISHEIRTPLNGVMGSLALIDRNKLTDQVNRYFNLLDMSVKRLEDFSNTILEASILRIKGEKALIFVEIDLAGVIQNAIDQCIDKFSQKNIWVDFQNITINSFVKGDQRYLLKCFLVVLDNAFKFSPKGEKIEIGLDNAPDGNLEITIADHGNGFSQVSLDNIYNALSNLDGHFDQNTGMGLHVAKLVIDAHSGFIRAGNRSPKGAIVEILIPVHRR